MILNGILYLFLLTLSTLVLLAAAAIPIGLLLKAVDWIWLKTLGKHATESRKNKMHDNLFILALFFVIKGVFGKNIKF